MQQTQRIRSVFSLCWHFDTESTPKPDKIVTVVFNPNVPKVREAIEGRQDGLCPNCDEKIKNSKLELKGMRQKWINDGNLKREEYIAIFVPFIDGEKRLRNLFDEACRYEAEKKMNLYHEQPLDRYLRQMLHMGMLAEEMQSDVTTAKKLDPRLPRTTIQAIISEYIALDAWEDVKKEDLCRRLTKSMVRIMAQVVQMREENDETLSNDIKDKIAKEFQKQGLEPNAADRARLTRRFSFKKE